MSLLVIAEHDGTASSPGALYPGTLNTITAAGAIGGDVHLLVAGHGIGEIADACANIAGVTKVLVADDEVYAHASTEDMATLIVAHVENYTHVLAPASTFGKALIPYAAALARSPIHFRHQRGRVRGYIRAANLRRQRPGHGEIFGPDQNDYRAHHRV